MRKAVLPRALVACAFVMGRSFSASAAEPVEKPAPAEPKAVGHAPSVSLTAPVSLESARASKQPTFFVAPITEGAIIAVTGGFAGTLDLVISSGELHPQEIPDTFDRNTLLGIDRGALSQRIHPKAAMLSNMGIGFALGYAVVDPIASAFRERNVETGLVDAVLYAESITITTAITNLAKIAVRRPRPLAYIAAEEHRGDPDYSNADTDSSLSFFSGHASVTASLAATATYLAFARSPGTVRPWLTLAAGAALTSFVAYERVRAGKHFPTDVITGAMVGAGVGTLVPHLHRVDTSSRHVWIGATPPTSRSTGMLSISGIF